VIKFGLVFVGMLAGMMVSGGGDPMVAAVTGAVFGYLLAELSGLQSRIKLLESQSAVSAKLTVTKPLAKPAARNTIQVPAAQEKTSTQQAGETELPYRQPPKEQTVTPAASHAADPASTSSWSEETHEPVMLDRLFALAKTWLTTGNIPVKVGVIVSFFGIAFLLRYAVERQIFAVPVELRLLGVAIFGIVLLATGWRLRERLPVYALSLQGGGVGILYLTIFAAMRFFQLLPVSLAFALLIALMCFAGILAVLQDSRALAVLGSVGGYLAPILLSTGSGNHVMLFSYYLVLNAAVLGIAWFRSWRELNIIGFVFTFVVGGLWGYGNYRADLFASTEPFLIANFVFYQAVAILFAVRQAPNLKGIVDSTLVFGTPVVAFALQARLVAGFEYGLAISAMVVALAYAVTAMALYRAGSKQFRLMVEAFIALGVAFATMAIPLGLDARWTAAAWALEGAALIWLGIRQKRRLAILAGTALQIGAGFAFASYGWQDNAGFAVLNGNYLGGMLIGLASLFSARYLDKLREDSALPYKLLGGGLFLWGLAWSVGSGMFEILDRAHIDYYPAAMTAYLAATTIALLYAGMHFDWRLARKATLFFLPALLLPATTLALASGHPLGAAGWAAWPLAFATQYFVMWSLREEFHKPVNLLHITTLLGLTGLVMWEVSWQVDRLSVGAVWQMVGIGLIPGVMMCAVRLVRERFGWPVNTNLRTYQTSTGILMVLQLALIGLFGLLSAGDPTPLHYIPLLNPLDIATALTALLAVYWFVDARDTQALRTPADWRLGLRVIGIFALITSTAAVVRALHHLGGVPWDFDVLFRSDLVQAGLSIYWGVLGFSGMVWGARSCSRITWSTGAALMAIVVAKLFLIDLGNSGTVERIVSFIGTGALLLIVGYFAPVPPRQDDDITLKPELEHEGA